MRSFVPILLSLILGTALSNEFYTPLEKDEQQDHQLRRQLCSPAASTTQTNFAVGEDVLVTLKICESQVEWFGIWPAGSNPATSSSVNWQYTCGGQSCASAQNTGGYLYGMNGQTEGSVSWPLSGDFQVFYHSALGTVGGQQFSIGGGASAPVAPAPAPVAIPTAPAPTPATGTCSPSIQINASCFTSGSQITATFVTCGAGVEWLGVYSAGAAVTSPSLNWQYACGGQQCARVMSARAYGLGFDSSTAGASSWPLSSGTYQIYFHSSAGTKKSNTFTVSSNCGSVPSSGTGTSAPAGTSASGTSAPGLRFLWATEEQEP